MKYLLFFFFCTAAFLVKAQESSVKQFLWLEGSWMLEGKQTYEKWQFVNDTMLGGIGYHFIKEEHDEDETDIIFDESIRLVLRETKYYYIPLVRNQNNGKEIEFEITSFTKNSFVAENHTHDFPKRIVYILENENALDTYIEGKQNGKNKRVNYRFTKTK